MEYNAAAALGELPGSLAASEAPTHDVNEMTVMILHALTIAGRRSVAVIPAMLLALSGCARQASYEPVVLSEDQAWIASTCDPGSPVDSGWQRHQIGGVTISVPPTYRVSRSAPFGLTLRGRGTLWLTLGRESKYEFEVLNRPRPVQKWCSGSLSGYPTEVLGWKHDGVYGLAALWAASWGGDDAGKWLVARMTTTRIQDARLLRSVLHTIRPVADTIR